jgi:DNA-binding response OmpR family regulator
MQIIEKPRILVIENDQGIADVVERGLRKHYTAELASDGSAGYALLQSHKHDLVILDISHPDITGLELCKMIRTQNTQIPVIVLTSVPTLDDKIKLYDSGVDDYLVKPFELKELLLKVAAFLKRNYKLQLTGDHILRVNNLEMNLDSKEVKRGSTKINLTAKEFQLLEFLLRNKNKVVSRSDIAYNVWDIDFKTNTNVIDVYINYLRNKVDKPFDHKLIRTQVGMGYVLKEKSEP